MTATPRLYGYFRSSSAWRVRLALALKGIAFETVPVNLLKGEHLAFDYGVISPLHAVPALVIDGHTLTESMAILEYLEETHPTPPLLPRHPALRAKVREIAQLVVSDIQPVQNLRVLKKLDADYQAGADGKQAWARHWITEGFVAVEKVIEQTAGEYSVGDQLTMADVCLVPQVYNARRFGVELDPFPTLAAVEARLSKLPAFEAATPARQPDCPPDLR